MKQITFEKKIIYSWERVDGKSIEDKYSIRERLEYFGKQFAVKDVEKDLTSGEMEYELDDVKYKGYWNINTKIL